MVPAVLFAFLCGVSLGLVLGRRRAASDEGGVAAAARGLPPPLPGVGRPHPARLPLGAPNKRARKVGITEEAFLVQDDILERMRVAWEAGTVDEAAVRALLPDADEPAPPAPPPPDVEALAADVDPLLANKVERVLERLRDQEPEADDPA